MDERQRSFDSHSTTNPFFQKVLALESCISIRRLPICRACRSGGSFIRCPISRIGCPPRVVASPIPVVSTRPDLVGCPRRTTATRVVRCPNSCVTRTNTFVLMDHGWMELGLTRSIQKSYGGYISIVKDDQYKLELVGPDCLPLLNSVHTQVEAEAVAATDSGSGGGGGAGPSVGQGRGGAVPARAAACAGCGSLPAAGHSHKLCKGCRALRYCGLGCQKRHWPQHKHACKAAVAAGSG
jgi:hypothetical protein